MDEKAVNLAILQSLKDAAEKQKDQLLDIEEAAEILKVEKRWLYKHAHNFPFAFKLPNSRLWRFSANKIHEYIAEMTNMRRKALVIANNKAIQKHQETIEKVNSFLKKGKGAGLVFAMISGSMVILDMVSNWSSFATYIDMVVFPLRLL